MPSSRASVRSVGYMLDKKGGSGSIAFNNARATHTSSTLGITKVIATRNASGLYSVVTRCMVDTTTAVPVYISVPVQVRREAIHRLHACLGHASIDKMRHIMKAMPHVCGSLTTRDLALFTSCPACRTGKTKTAERPKTSYTRSYLFAHRLHGDTTGVIRPSTTGGFRRALVVVDDASRWIFVRLLRAALLNTKLCWLYALSYRRQRQEHMCCERKYFAQTMEPNSLTLRSRT